MSPAITTQSANTNTACHLEAEITELLTSRCLIPGSLGIWDSCFRKLCLAWGKIEKEIHPGHILFSADNGIVSEGYIGFSGDITRLHTINMLHGGAAVTNFCRFNHIPVTIADAGIISDTPIGYDCKARQGSRNFLKAPAMTAEEFQIVTAKARQLIESKISEGINLISFGEMGIGNTTTSAAVLSALTGLDPRITVGPGSGADKEALEKKQAIVRQGLALHQEHLTTPQEIIAHVGGFDIAALTEAMLTCRRKQIPFVIDGFITAVALACACRIDKETERYALPSHQSRETGMPQALAFANIRSEEVPLQAHMALGEGTGAVLMVQLLRTIHYGFLHMASFDAMMKEHI